MNILYYLENYPKLSESWVRTEIRELQKRGHNVAVFSHASPDPLQEDLPDTPHQVAVQPSLDSISSIHLRHVLDPDLYQTLTWTANPLRQAYVVYYACVARAFVESLPYEIDHVHGHFASTQQVAANYLARTIGATHTVMTHANDLYSFDHEATRQYLYEHCDNLLTISEYNRKFMIQESDVPLTIDVVPACFNASRFTPSGRAVPNRILSVARHVEKKGLKYAMEAISLLNEEVEYHLVGKGPQTDQLRRRAVEFGIEDQVSFLGHISEDHLYDEYDEAALFLLPSVVDENGDRDGIPVSIKEAMAMEIPVVTTDISGIPELVDDEVGWVVSPRDPEALANVISQAFASDLSEYGQEARKRVESHRSEIVVPQILDTFRSC